MVYTTSNMTNDSNITLPGNTFGRPRGPYYQKEWVYAGVGIYVPLSILITFGNLLVIVAFFSTPKLKTKTNYFIVSLAMADLVVGTFSVPMWIYILITEDFENPVYKYYLSVDMVSGVSSIIHLACISLERAYAIVAPLKHMHIKKASIYFAIAISWILGIICPIIKEYNRDKKIFISTFIACVFFFLPLLFILAAYAVIFTAAKRSMAIRRGAKSMKKDLQIAYTVALVIGVFVVCWLPFFVTILLYNFCPPCKPFVWNMNVLMVVKLFHYFNSVCNPVIYCVRNKRFNLAFIRILRLVFCCKGRISQRDDFESTVMPNHTFKATFKKKPVKNGEHMRLTVPCRYDSRSISKLSSNSH